MQCDRCEGEVFTRAGRDRSDRQLWACTQCGRRLTTRSMSAFDGHRFPDGVIALAVRWYLRYRLGYADVAEWLAERGPAVDRSTAYDRVHAFAPRFLEAARGYRHRIGRKWRVDQTLLKIGGRQRYLFRARDGDGQAVDVPLSEHRDAASAGAFFEPAIASPEVAAERVTSDKAKGYPPALRATLPRAEHRGSEYPNNGLERVHQHLQGRVRPMRHFNRLATAETFCRGHAFIPNLAQGVSGLTADVSPNLRLKTAWAVLTVAL